MTTALWLAQALAGMGFLIAGILKQVRTRAQLAPMMGWVNDFSPGAIRAIGIAEIAGALGLVLPRAMGVLPWLTSVAGACLVLLMLGAVATHVRRKELRLAGAPGVLILLAAFVSYGSP